MTGHFVLASGGQSNFFDMKPTLLDPEGGHLIAEAIINIIGDEQIDYIGGLESGAISLATAVSLKSWLVGNQFQGFMLEKSRKREAPYGLLKGI